jgi:transposase
MGYIQGINRDQTILFPECVDDYIGEDSLVRFIDLYVDKLDLVNLGFKHANSNPLGRKSYDPKDLLKLYIYGYVIKIRSSRRLEVEIHRNIELMWLLRKLKPDFRTIADFRKDNLTAIKKVFKEFIVICAKLKLFENELVAIDGSKFRAQNSRDKCFTKKQIEEQIQKLDESIDQYLKKLDSTDKEEEDREPITVDSLKEKIKLLEDKKVEYKKLKQEMESNGNEQISLTDPDSRLMKTRHGHDVCYNVQIAVTNKHKLIIVQDVKNDCNDQNQLSEMSKNVKDTIKLTQEDLNEEEIDKQKIEITADTGYFNGLEVKECIENGIVPYIPEPPKHNGHTKNNKFDKNCFKYNKEKDIYICPNNCNLCFSGYTTRDKKTCKVEKIYICKGYKECKLRDKCSDNKRGRRVHRWEHEKIMDEMKERVQKDLSKTKDRKKLVEHPFGTMKRVFDQGYFLLKGLKKVKTEFSLITLAYNIKRVIKILGIREMMNAII